MDFDKMSQKSVDDLYAKDFAELDPENNQCVLIPTQIKGSVNAKDTYDGETLLHMAVRKQNLQAIRFLIDSGADPNLKNNVEETPFSLVLSHYNDYSKIKSSCVTIMKMLVEGGADVNTRYGGQTALHYAVHADDAELVKLEVSQGADVNAINKCRHNWTPLHYAAAYTRSSDPAIFESLLSAGADVNAKDFFERTPIHILVNLSRLSSTFEITKVLAKYGADFHARDQTNWNPMDYAIKFRKTERVKALVLHGGVDVNSKYTPESYKKSSILHLACYNCDQPTVKFLLTYGADVNLLNADNKSPLQNVIDFISFNADKYQNTQDIKFLRFLFKWNPDVNTVAPGKRHILNSSSCEIPIYLWQTILEHLAKLKCVKDDSIHPDILETIFKNSEYKRYFDECCLELEKARKWKLHNDSWVTFFTLLVHGKNKLIQYACNSNLTRGFRKVNCIRELPIYGIFIFHKFTKAMDNGRFWRNSTQILSDLLPINVDPTHRIVVKILSFFDSKDLKILGNKL